MKRPRISRRGVLGRALVAAAGVAGLGVAGRADARGSPAGSFVLYARDLRSSSPEGRRGGLPRRGERLTTHAVLLDRASGHPVGELHGAAFALTAPGGIDSDAERLELHTFRLEDGLLIGSGTAGSVDGAFAIVGGTGRYAGARGTYVAVLNRPEHGGDGTAEFVFTLLA